MENRIRLSWLLLWLHEFGAGAAAAGAAATEPTSSTALEISALLLWKNSLQFLLLDSQTHLQTWNATSDHSPCSWEGIHCNRFGSVAEIDLSNRHLSGTLDTLNISSLHSLTHLDLSGNRLTGILSRNLSFASLTNLVYLNLHYNNLYNNLDNMSLIFPHSLTHLDLSFNNIHGIFSHNLSFASLTNLVYLNLSDNDLYGNLDNISLVFPHSLTHLDLSFNDDLQGNLSRNLSFMSLTNLVYLDFNGNNLYGSLDNISLAFPPSLTHLGLSLFPFYSILSNNISFASLTNLLYLDLSSNNFYSKLEYISLVFPPSLTHLDLAFDNLRSIPNHNLNFASLTNLVYLNLRNNDLYNNLDNSSFVFPPSLTHLDLGFNNLHYILFHNLSFVSLTNLVYLDLRYTNLNINLDNISLVFPPSLTHLDLSFNHLGSIHSRNISFASLTNLVYLDLSGNDIYSNLDNISLVFPPSLTHLDLSRNNLNGALEMILFLNWTGLSQLNLEDNSITGCIPPHIGRLRNLQHVALGGNAITGSVPNAIGLLQNLEFLDLSENRLSGEIPWTVSNLSKLTFLSFDSNKISGAIPPEVGHMSSLQWLNLMRLDGCRV